jgi:hypothetical protein
MLPVVPAQTTLDPEIEGAGGVITVIVVVPVIFALEHMREERYCTLNKSYLKVPAILVGTAITALEWPSILTE